VDRLTEYLRDGSCTGWDRFGSCAGSYVSHAGQVRNGAHQLFVLADEPARYGRRRAAPVLVGAAQHAHRQTAPMRPSTLRSHAGCRSGVLCRRIADAPPVSSTALLSPRPRRVSPGGVARTPRPRGRAPDDRAPITCGGVKATAHMFRGRRPSAGSPLVVARACCGSTPGGSWSSTLSATTCVRRRRSPTSGPIVPIPRLSPGGHLKR
jgi:hypothetical protein